MKIEKLDFTKLTRDPDRCVTSVVLGTYEKQNWLLFGRADVQRVSEREDKFHLIARARDGATDGCHDGAQILRVPLVGVRFGFTSYHTTHLNGYVAATEDDLRNFRVPTASYDPFREAERCVDCKEDPHVFIDYLPPSTEEMKALYDQVKGQLVEIFIGTNKEA